MGTYVYALNTKVRTIGAVTVGVAEYRYKDGWGVSNAVHNRTCGRRIEHFKNVGLPDYFIMTKPEEGGAVFAFTTKEGRPIYSCFSDGISFNKVGTLKKVGRSWTIVWN